MPAADDDIDLPPGTEIVYDSDLPGNPEQPAHLDDWQTTYLAAFPRTIQDRASEDPGYRDQLLAARHILTDLLRLEAFRRALDPIKRPIFQRGELAGWVEERDNKHLEWLLERISPEEFHLARRLEVGGDGGGPIRFEFVMGEAELVAQPGDYTEHDDQPALDP